MKNILDKAAKDAEDGGTGGGKDLYSINGLNAALEDFFGGGLSSLSQEDLASVITAFSMLGNEGNTVAGAYAAQIARAYLNDLFYLYDQYMVDRVNEYVSLKAIGDVTEYRYIYHGNVERTTMTGLGSSLTFKSGTDIVSNADGKKRTLSGKAVRQNVVYIREKDALLYFSCEEEAVPHTQIAVCVTPPVKERALAFIEYLKS